MFEMSTQFTRKTEAGQFDEVLIDRASHADDDVSGNLPRICHLHRFVDFHFS
jgi:hypothetical protein